MQRTLVEYRLPFFEQLRNSLLEREIELSLIYGHIDYGRVGEESKIADCVWAHFEPNISLRLGGINLIWQPNLKHLQQSDLVIVEQANKLLLNYYLLLLRYFKKFKFCLWGHGRDLSKSEHSIANKFKYALLRKCDWWFAYTDGVRDFLISKNYPRCQITSVQNAIDTNRIRKAYQDIPLAEVEALRRQLGIEGKQVAIFCGSMYPEKRIDFVLDACRLIRSEIPDFEIIIIGSGEDADKVHSMASSLTWVHYVGPVFGVDRVKYFKIAKIQMMPSAVGLGILDSFAMETPLITTTHRFHGPEIQYLRHKENGWITANELTIYAQAIIDVLRCKNFEMIVGNCQKDADKYTIETMVENFRNGILSCLES